jgi:hypothetical protein
MKQHHRNPNFAGLNDFQRRRYFDFGIGEAIAAALYGSAATTASISAATATATTAAATAAGATAASISAAGASAAAAAAAGTSGLIGTGGLFSAGTALTNAGFLGTAISAAGAVKQGIDTSKAADYNAEVAKSQAKDAINRGSIAMGEQRTKTAQLIGAQHVAMGASGIVPDEGSFGDLLAQSAAFGERDAQRIRDNTQREALGYKSQATIDEMQGSQALNAGIFKGAESLLTGSFNLFRPLPYYKKWVTENGYGY